MNTETFDGTTFVQERDGVRLSKQLAAVKAVMLDGHLHTLSELSALCECSEASASARLRDLRKARFGGWNVVRKHVANGLHTYQLQPTPMPVAGGAS